MSTNVTSTTGLPLVVERTMMWDATGYGAHTEKATAGPAPTWYFAEGSQGFFQTFLLLSNPGAAASTATVQWLLESGTTVTTTHNLAPTSRTTVFAGDVPGLVDQSFGIVVNFTQPGVAERAMYFGTPLFNGGHESAGETAPATDWFLAEGATGTFFTTFVLMANPNAAAADLNITYFPESGVPVTKTTTLPGNQRLTLNIATEDPTLAGDVGGHARPVDAADCRRARAVLAGAAGDVVRSAQQLRRDRGRPRSGASPKAASADPTRRRRSSCWRIRARRKRP